MMHYYDGLKYYFESFHPDIVLDCSFVQISLTILYTIKS